MDIVERLKELLRKRKGRLVCAWCGVIMGKINSEYDSHGICHDCCEKKLKELGLRR